MPRPGRKPGIDFAEEEVPEDVLARARADASSILEEIRQHLDDSRRGESSATVST
jgi:tRNA U34 5-carboxymethylaminomethyl modifying GTPase MnmE/TrmE